MCPYRTSVDEEVTGLDSVDRFIADRLSPVLVGADLSPLDLTASTAGDWPQLDPVDVSAPVHRDEDCDFRERVIRPASALIRDFDDLRPSSNTGHASPSGRISGTVLVSLLDKHTLFITKIQTCFLFLPLSRVVYSDLTTSFRHNQYISRMGSR